MLNLSKYYQEIQKTFQEINTRQTPGLDGSPFELLLHEVDKLFTKSIMSC